MKRSRAWKRALLGCTLVAACLAAAIAPALSMVQAAPPEAPASASLPPKDLVISSFRFSGTGGSSDEYIEIFNRGSGPVQLQDYSLVTGTGSATTTLYTFPNFSLASGQYYLVHYPTYTVSPLPGGATPAADAGYTTTPVPDVNDTAGSVALLNDAGDQLDAAGYDISVDAVTEGTALTPPTNLDQGYFRKVVNNQFVDTNDNSQDFTAQDLATPSTAGPGIPTVTISGSTGVGGVALTWSRMAELTGSATPPTSNASGDYSFTVPANWSGTVTPSLAGYTFTPASQNYSNLTANQTQNFTAAAVATPTNTATPGSGGAGPLSVIINEVAWYGVRGNTGADWIELYNPTGSAINMDGWRLYSVTDFTPNITLTGTIPANGYYLVAHANSSSWTTSTPTATPSSCTGNQIFKPEDHVIIDQYFTGDLSISGEKLNLINASGNHIDSANIQDSAWRAGSITNSATMERRGVVPDTSSAWITYANPGGNPSVHTCSGVTEWGTPKQANWALGKTQTPTPRPTRTNTPPAPTPFGHMVINEFLPRAGYDWNQDGTVDVFDEFVELYNLGPVTANLNGWKIDVISPGGNTSYSLSGLSFKTGDRMVFYGLKTGLKLHDLGGTVRLINNRNVIVDARGYDPVQAPDQSTCRIPEGQYWTFPCFPTPGNPNSKTGTHAAPPPAIASLPPPCVMSDIIPTPFREAECHAFGADIYNPAYWDDQSGFRQFPVPDLLTKWRQVVE